MQWRVHGYGLVLALVVASTIFQLATTGSDTTRFAVVALQAMTLVAAVRTARPERYWVRGASLAATLAVVAALVMWIADGEIPPAPAAVVNGLLVAVAPAVLAGGLLRDLRARRQVALHTLAGVLSIYLLAGAFFSFAFGVIDAVDPDALFAGQAESTRAEQLYFSFVTLCTVGYGDFTPATDLPRALSVAEMLIGQIYLVTIVALIVGNLGRRQDRATPTGDEAGAH
jgi:hypothetical protein